MNVLELRSKENYYTSINGVKILVDYTNERLKILDYHEVTDSNILGIVEFASENGLGKIISNCRIRLLEPYRKCGFKIEGLIKGFFKGEDAYCVSFFIDKKREISIKTKEEDEIISKCDFIDGKFSIAESTKYMIRSAEASDVPQMTKLFLSVFKTYPSPVFNGDYLQKIMKEQVLFKVAVEDDKIISIASADMDKENLNAEMTDCATYPEHRGRGILPNLIKSLEQELLQKEFITLYSLSRAINPGINRTLGKLQYRYCGRLVNNCHICGGFEDMNIWVKNLNRG